MATSAYLMLSLAGAVAVFCLVWWSLNDDAEDVAWVVAGLCASATIAGAVTAREILARRRFARFAIAPPVSRHRQAALGQPKKLSIERHAALIKNIERMSAEANKTHALPESHLQIVEACNEYFRRIEKELPAVSPGSTRLGAFRRGQEKARAIHREHLLRWSAEETQKLVQESKIRVTMPEKVETLQRALSILENGLREYPEEVLLQNSAGAVKGNIVSVKVAHWVEEAEKEAFKQRGETAVDLYQNALFYLSKEGNYLAESEREMIANEISDRINKLKGLLAE